jgi:hypothetical protein
MLTVFSFNRGALITVKVGGADDQKEFTIHEGVIYARSELFKRAMKGNWIEAKERVVNLPEDTPEIFEAYVNYVYTNQLPTTGKELDKQSRIAHDHIVKAEYIRLTKIYVLAKRLQDRIAKNAIVTAIVALAVQVDSEDSTLVHGAAAVTNVYNGILEGSRARQLIVDFWVYLSHRSFTKQYDHLPREFLQDLCMAHMSSRDEDRGYVWPLTADQYLEEEGRVQRGGSAKAKEYPK